MKRIFIVGCPRSGTTFLQSMMAAHPQLASFPETHFWELTVPEKFRYRLLKMYGRRSRQLVGDYLEKYGYPEEVLDRLAPIYLSYRSWSQALAEILDSLVPKGKMGWIEKTPRHLHYIPYIRKSIPGAEFLHIVRSGKDVVASMYEVSHNYPRHWNGPRSIEQCVERWRTDVGLSAAYRGEKGHSFVRYERLRADTERELRRLCRSLDLEYDGRMGEEYREQARGLVGGEEAWKASNIHGRSGGDKFKNIFSEEEQKYILERTEEVSLDFTSRNDQL